MVADPVTQVVDTTVFAKDAGVAIVMKTLGIWMFFLARMYLQRLATILDNR